MQAKLFQCLHQAVLFQVFLSASICSPLLVGFTSGAIGVAEVKLVKPNQIAQNMFGILKWRHSMSEFNLLPTHHQSMFKLEFKLQF